MSYLLICRLDQIAETAVRHKVREVISLVAAGQSFHRPGIIAPARHLKLGLNDIDSETEGLVLPDEAHVAEIITFARAWDQTAPLLVHCWFGISRSPAAALIAALAVRPEFDDADLARRLRRASPFVTPNRRLVEIGDRLLGRGGRLISAVAAIGRGAETDRGDIVRLDIAPRAPEPKDG